MSRAAVSLVVLCLASPATADQAEDALRTALLGKTLTVKLDMPASHKGVDLRFDKEEPFNISEHSSRLREHDASIREGDRVPITHVKLKDDLIEIHLAGGGFNWAFDKTTKSFTPSSKSSRESDLEKRIRTETDRERKRDMQDELNDLRRRRERRDDREREEVEAYNREASIRDRDRSLRSGSRFNLRFKKKVPPGALTGEGVMDYLSRWAELGGGAGRPSASQASSPAGGGAGLDWLRRGLLRNDVEKRLGRPRKQGSCRAGDAGDCTLLTYDSGADEVEATFVDDVLTKFTVRRR